MPNGCFRSKVLGSRLNDQDSAVDHKTVSFSPPVHRKKSFAFCTASLLMTGLLLLFLGVSASTASAQAVYGSIAGTVLDSSGGGVVAAKITITDLNRNTVRATETNGNGFYNQAHLIIGHYKVQVEAPGFKTAISEVDVAVDTVSTFDVALQPGDIKQTITVTDEVPLLKTERTDVSTTLSERQVDELPNFGRNFSQLLLLTPGTVQFCWGDTSTENPQGGIAVNVNGQMFVGVGSILDGTDNRDFLYGNMLIVPNLDAVVQMKVTSADYDAEFGQVSAAVVSTSIKSGTNEFHGSAFYYNRNNATYARDPFAQAPPNNVIPTTNWNQFGGSIGGPIKKDKLFFFADYQGTRAIDGGSGIAQVPTAAMRGGDFSAWIPLGDLIYNPFPINPATGLSVTPGSRQQFVATPTGPNANPLCTPASTDYVGTLGGCPNMIPTSMISQVSLNLIKLLPMPTNPNAPPGTPNYSASVTDTYHANAVDGRADYFYSDNLRFFDRYTFTQFYKSAPGIFGPVIGGPASSLGYTGSAPTRPQSNSFGFDYTLRPNLVTDFRFGWYKQRINVEPYTSGDFATQAGALGLNIPSDPSTNDYPHFGIQGPDGFDIGDGLAFNCNCPLIERMQQFQFANNWTWTKGKHTIKFGPDIRRLQNLRVPSDIHRSGDVYFSNAFTEGANGTGLGTASFLLGYASDMGRYVSTSTDAGEREWRTFFYGEDMWRVTSKLTVNFGLRWEIYYPQTVTGKDQGGWIDLSTGEVLVAGENGVGLNGNVQNTFKNLAPRLGIAYQVNSKTVVRLGYGRSFDVGMFGSIFGHTATQNLPVLGIQSVQSPQGNAWDPAFQLSVGPPLITPAQVLADSPLGPDGDHLLPPGITPWVFPRKMLLPTVDAWNATIQREITRTFSFEAGYVGNKGTHVQTGENNWLDINAATTVGYCNSANPASPTTGCLSYNQRQPYFAKYGWTQVMRCVCDPGDNHYNSLQMKAEKRMSYGLSVLGVYTFSHAKNHDAPDFLYDPSIEYGRPNWQRNHVLTAATIYELPFGKGKQFLSNVSSPLNYLVGGWQLANNTTWMSGLGFSVSYSDCGLDTDSGVCFLNKVGNTGVPDQNQYHWFAVASAPLAANGQTSGPWQRPLFGTFGDSGRNTLLGPKWFDSDLSAIKNFPVKEQMRIQFRAEVYNVFNHANLGNPNSCVDCGGAGQIFSLANNASMRKMQFALRFEF
jgi:hypothetical protein